MNLFGGGENRKIRTKGPEKTISVIVESSGGFPMLNGITSFRVGQGNLGSRQIFYASSPAC